MNDVARGISEKLIRRHPHVFGNSDVSDTEAVLSQWDEIKRQETSNRIDSLTWRIIAVLSLAVAI